MGAPLDDRQARPTRGERVALLGSSAAVLLTVLLQAPGRIVPETKLDLLVDPGTYLGRAMSAWDPSAGFGRVQNQAVGYLFPMGAFTWTGHLLHVPAWLTQRLWITAVILVALWGAHRLARAVGIGSAAGRVTAAWAYAFAPATMATVAFQSAGQLPYSLAPWVLLPLVSARPGDRPRRVAARSTLFVLAMGGVNGAAAFAVLPLVAIWFLGHRGGRDRRRLFAWWSGGAILATFWWIVPLLVSVRYGVRFTRYTEQASLTTSTESATEILRGTGNWLSYLPIRIGHWLPGAHAMSVDRVAIVGSVLVAAIGMWGLARKDLPGRSWLLPSALLGAIAMGVAYTGSAGGSFGGVTGDLLDGPLAPFRNVHKFAAVLRLPLALGLGHAVAVAMRAITERQQARHEAAIAAAAAEAARAWPPVDVDAVVSARRRPRPAAFGIPVLAGLLIVTAIAPALIGGLTAPGSFEDVPKAWREAARWIDDHQGAHRTLVLPGSAFGEYTWGRPLDEPLSSVLDGDWAVRDLIPLGGNGSTRLLDGIDQALLGDHLPDGFVPTLRRMGIKYLLVRNDLDLERTGGPGAATMRRLLATAPELLLVKEFGPRTSDPGSDGRMQSYPGNPSYRSFRQLAVYEVPSADDQITAYTDTAVVGGGPEALLAMSVRDTTATVLGVDADEQSAKGGTRITTDTARRRDVLFGAIRNNATYTLTADEASPITGEAPEDRWPADEAVGLSEAVDEGAAISDDPPRGKLLDPERQPGNAFDGSPVTAWTPNAPAPGHWLQASFPKPRPLTGVELTLPSKVGRRIGRVTIETDHGIVSAGFGADGTAETALPAGSTRRVRITVESVIEGVEARAVGIAEVRFREAGATRADVARGRSRAPRRPVRTAEAGPVGSSRVATVAALSRLRRDAWDRYRIDEEGALDRIVRLPSGAGYRASGTASTVPGPALDQLLRPLRPTPTLDELQATASTQWHDQPAFEPLAAVDGDPRTAWVSGIEVTAPVLRVAWTTPATISKLRILAAPAPTYDPIDTVSIVIGDQRFTRRLPADGWIEIPPTRTDEVRLAFPRADARATTQRVVGVREVEIPELSAVPARRLDRRTEVSLPCGEGPALSIDGRSVPTRASTTVGAILDAGPIEWSACSPLTLATGSGSHRIAGGPDGPTQIDTLTIGPAHGQHPPLLPPKVRVRSWGKERRVVDIEPGVRILATTENFNDGWTAHLGSDELTPVRVDGWRQGWRVPVRAGGEVTMEFAPGTTQRLGLLVGLLAALVLVALAVLPGRRRVASEGIETDHAPDAGDGGDADPQAPNHTERREPGVDATAARATSRRWSPPATRDWPVPVLFGLAALTGVALGGVAVVALLPLVLLPKRERWLPLLAAALTIGAGCVAFASPKAAIVNSDGTLSAPAQILATIALLALAASALPDLRPPRSEAEPDGPVDPP